MTGERVRPSQEATEAAVVHLLQDALLSIRYEAAPLRDDGPERQRLHRAWVLADLVHNLPACLAPERRARIHEGVEYLWQTASEPKRAWLRSRWDAIGYDHTWLNDPPGADRGA